MHAAIVETPKPAEKQNEKCTPVRRGRVEASVHTEAKSPPPPSKRPSRRRNRMKNARRRVVFQYMQGQDNPFPGGPFPEDKKTGLCPLRCGRPALSCFAV